MWQTRSKHQDKGTYYAAAISHHHLCQISIFPFSFVYKDAHGMKKQVGDSIDQINMPTFRMCTEHYQLFYFCSNKPCDCVVCNLLKAAVLDRHWEMETLPCV